ncbi:PGC [Symbiodinium pilosum]|uniref:PGC protein n=1 Tax=Symbiodinium pilosum TaxID=2952 RepID=A0A812X260_SYMPI|nr:PGC [Symbiodinium pilosum]
MDEESWSTPRPRAFSCPAGGMEDSDNEEQQEAKSQDRYLEEVVREASKLRVRQSRGSAGHPEVCRRPCVFLAAGRCSQGDTCGYCHREHNEARARPDKKQRALLGGLSEPELFDILLPHLQVRAGLPQLRGKAWDLLRLLEDTSPRSFSSSQASDYAASPSSSSPVVDGKLRSLNKTLERMSFSGLVALLCESLAKGNLREQLLQALEDVRAQCDNAS